MKRLKSSALLISTTTFRFTLFVGILIICFLLLFSTASRVKETIVKRGVYKAFVNSIIKDNLEGEAKSSLPLSDPNVQKIINEAFPPETLQYESEKVIDATYAWLNGESPTLKFSVDFTFQRLEAADKLAEYAFNRMRSLPVCFAAPEEIDPFTAGCQPPNTNLAIEQQKLSTAIAGEGGILPQAVFTEADLPKDQQGETMAERYAFAPSAYMWAKRAPWILSALLILSVITLLALHRNKRRGLQQIGVTLVGSGLALLVTPLIILFILPRFTDSLAFSQSESQSQALIAGVSNQLNQDFNVYLINITIQLILLGVLVLLAERFSRPSSAYANLARKAGVVSSERRKPSSGKYVLKPETVPIQSSEESKRRRPKRTKNKKYRTIPKKEI